MHPIVAFLLAGMAQVDITPTWFPVIVNCYFLERQSSEVVSPIYAKALVLEQGKRKTAMVVVDSCMMPRELIDRAKQLAFEKTGIPVDRQMISATHTHMAPAAMSCLGSRVDAKYAEWLPGKIAEAIVAANARLKPARLGTFAVEDAEHTFVRQFFYRSDRKQLDPFGDRTVQANMHPGYENPDMTLPTGPKDATLTMLAVQGTDGTPMGIVANYAMHYFDAKPISPSHFGVFAKMFSERVAAPPGFVVMLNQGVSGDLMWMDYSKPAQKDFTVEAYTRGLVDSAEKAYRGAVWDAKPVVKMLEAEQEFSRRKATPERMAWARKLMAEMAGREPKNQPEVYARELIQMEQVPVRKLKLQVMQIGELGVVAWPNEVFSISGLKLRERSGFRWLMNVALANGAEGYIPPAELHPFGGYTTWPAKTAGLEVTTEARLVAKYTAMLETLKHGRQSAKHERGYWPMEELEARADLRVDGLKAYGVPGKVGRAMYLSQGKLVLPGKQREYVMEYWMWPVDVKQWVPVRVEQTVKARRIFVNGQMQSESAPLEELVVVDGFEGAIDEVRLK